MQHADDRASEFRGDAAMHLSVVAPFEETMSVTNKNDARPNALETLHGVIEGHRPALEEALAERGAIWLLPGPVREAVADILHAAGRCNGTT
jgi:hypothetical protein